MKKIEAFIKPHRVNDVRASLSEAGFHSFQMYEVLENMDSTHKERVSGTVYNVDLMPRSVILFLVSDSDAEKAVGIIKESAKTGNPDDGRILVSSLDQVDLIGDS